MAKNYWEKSLKDFNPYNNTGRSSVPAPRNSTSNSSSSSSAPSASRDNSSAALLRNSEASALNPTEKHLFTGTGRPANSLNQRGKISNFKANRKKYGIIATIATALIAIFVFLGSSNALLPGALSAQFTEQTDLSRGASVARLSHVIKSYLAGNSENPATAGSELSSDFKSSLANFNIDVESNGNGYNFKWKDGTIISSDNFDDMFDNNLEFRTNLMNAQGNRATNYFDNTADTYYNKRYNRNGFKNYKTTNDNETNNKNYKDTLSPKFDNDTADITTSHQKETTITENVTDENGNTVTNSDGSPQTREVKIIEQEYDQGSTKSESADFDTAKSQASEFIGKFNQVSQVLSWGCTIMRTGNMITSAAANLESFQSAKYFLGQMESISKMMAGKGSESGINEVINFFNTPATSTIEDYNNVSASANSENESLSVSIGETQVSGTPLESNVRNILAETPIDKKTAKNFSLSRGTNTILQAFGYTSMTAAGCAINDIGQAAASLAVYFIPGLGQARIVGGLLMRIGSELIASVAISGLFSFLVPTLARSLFMNTFDNASGIVAGEIFSRGAIIANNDLNRSGGMAYGSEADVLAYNQVNNTAIALDAESDRLNRSPFDTTSKNTFLGSIAYSLLGTSLSSGFTSSLSSLSHTTSKSLASLMGSVSAAGEDSSLSTTFGDCKGSNVASSVYCSPTPVAATGYLNTPLNDSAYLSAISSQVDDSGNIDKNGNLAKTISYCFDRESIPSEIPDARILNEIQNSSPSLSAIPFIGEVTTIIDSFREIANLGWATGDNCKLGSPNNPDLPYYQLYAFDERIREQISGSGDSAYVSPITAYREAYDQEHPITNDVDFIARVAGVTTEDAELLIALADYADFMDDYDADSRLAMTTENTKIHSSSEIVTIIASEKIHFDTTEDSGESEKTILAILPETFIYADLRNRSYAA